MAVSKEVLGLNARNYLYVKRFNKRTARERADDKLSTKETFIAHGVPTTKLLATFRTFSDVRAFDWTSLPKSFVVKPSRGFGGQGIIVVRGWDGAVGKSSRGAEVRRSYIESEIFSILDGAYSLRNLPDAAFIEERVVVAGTLRKLSHGGVPDIRVIVLKKVPVMAMLRLPTEASEGKANLHQGALGIGIDLRTGITTHAVQYEQHTMYLPGTRTKLRGLKIPHWEEVLTAAIKAQHFSGLGYAGIDVVLDEEKGPLVLEVNARPGLAIQLANSESLRTRLERVAGLRVESVKQGIELARQLYAEHALRTVRADDNILHVVEKVVVQGPKKKKTIDAKIDSGAYRTSLDMSLVEELGLDPHHEKVFVRSGSGTQHRHTVKVSFKLRGKDVDTVASYTDRTHLKFPMIIGRRDLNGFLIDPSAYSDEVD